MPTSIVQQHPPHGYPPHWHRSATGKSIRMLGSEAEPIPRQGCSSLAHLGTPCMYLYPLYGGSHWKRARQRWGHCNVH